MGFGALRDAILAMKDPLDISHVQRCNQAEAEFWKRSEDYVIKPSDELLQFDCGGQVRIMKCHFLYLLICVHVSQILNILPYNLAMGLGSLFPYRYPRM
jgi:hypothetical protein